MNILRDLGMNILEDLGDAMVIAAFLLICLWQFFRVACNENRKRFKSAIETVLKEEGHDIEKLKSNIDYLVKNREDIFSDEEIETIEVKAVKLKLEKFLDNEPALKEKNKEIIGILNKSISKRE